ncbi:MAG: type III pantothenate kinase [Oscillospiraceae bacterium]|nr:type III pantothenate kinase [Oscillospiraceae bacterium]
MVLAIDIGNTNIVIGCFQEEKIIFVERISTNQTGTALEFAVSFKSVLEIYSLKSNDIEGSILSSVVPSITGVVKQAVEKITQKKCMVVGPGIKTGLKISIDNPAQLGSDIVIGAVAALEISKGPLAIIDMGTATTVSVINEKNEFIGGMIMPGVAISMDALNKRTAQLPKIAFEPPKRIISSNTIDCMKSGMIYGFAGSIDGLLDQIESELKTPVTAIATGGLAEVIVPHCRHRNIIIDNTLLLKGMRTVYLKNK